MGSIQVTQSINTGSTSNSDTGGTTAVNSESSSNTKLDSTVGDRLIYTNNLTDADYKNYYVSINPALPTEYSGEGNCVITGSYNQSGSIISISSSTIQITFTGGLSGSLSFQFSGTISGAGTTLSIQKLVGVTDPSVPSLPLNISITIRNAAISSGNLTATISISFTAGFVNLDSGIQYETLAPGAISSQFSGGSLSGSNRTLVSVSFNSRKITHKLFF